MTHNYCINWCCSPLFNKCPKIKKALKFTKQFLDF